VKFLSIADDDIFISYTRLDATTYATGLADELTKRGFSCFIDRLGTVPDKNLPDMLLRKIKSCTMLVVVGTERAGTRETIAHEVETFLATGRRTSLVPIDFGGAVYRASWYGLVEGIAPEPETNANALDDGNPSASVVSRIEKQFNYKRRNERLQRATVITGVVLVALLLAGMGAGVFAAEKIKEASEAQEKANAATLVASTAREQARLARDEAVSAQNEATKQKRLADEATREADAKTRLADEAARRARDAEAARKTAQSKADREEAIGDARARANRAQTMLRQRPAEVTRSLGFAVDAMTKSSAVGVPLVEADTALRDGIAVLPMLQRFVPLENVSATALSPDGEHVATVSGNTLRIYESGSEISVEERDWDSSAVALSSGLRYAAGVLANGGIRIFDLKDDARSHTIPLDESISVESIALSPGGRYVAVSYGAGEDIGRYSILKVFDATTGRTVVAFDLDLDAATGPVEPVPGGNLNMLIKDVAFGPTGNLAVAGTEKSPKGGRFQGQIFIWSLPLGVVEGQPEPDLTDDAFRNPQIVSQRSDVVAVAPGPDDTSFATDAGVWKRLSGQTEFTSIGRPAEPSEVANSSVEKVAFTRNGRGLALVRSITPGDMSEEQDWVEVWDATGHRGVTEIFHATPIDRVGFRPDGALVASAHTTPSEDDPIRFFPVGDSGAAPGAPFGPTESDGQVLFISHDARYFVTSRDGVAEVWDVWSKRRSPAPFSAQLERAEVASVSPDGSHLALFGPDAEQGFTIAVYELEDSAYHFWKRIEQNGTPETMSLSAGGRRLAALYGYDVNFVHVWDVPGERNITPESLQYEAELETESYGRIPDVTLMALSPDGRFLVLADRSNQTRLVSLPDGKVNPLLERTTARAVAFNADGTRVAVGTDEGLLHIFETANPETEIARLQHTGAVTAVAFADDGRYVATASSDPHPYGIDEEESYPLRVWLMWPEDLLREASTRLAALISFEPK